MAKVLPNLNQSGIRLAEFMLEIRTSALDSIIRHYQFRDDTLTNEVKLFSEFRANKSFHEDRMQMFLNTQLNMRRQHALQKELDQRRVRLNELRELRMEAIRKLREQVQEEERIKQELEAQKVKEASKPLTTVVSYLYIFFFFIFSYLLLFYFLYLYVFILFSYLSYF